MIYFKKGDLLKAPQKAIAHQVNCQGVMKSGVAKQIKETYPDVYKAYKRHCEIYDNVVGDCLEVTTTNERIIFNLFGQKDYGYNGKRYTSYFHLAKSLDKLVDVALKFKIKEIAIPYKMSCDRGGADWNVVLSMFQDISDEYGIDFYIYKLEE